MATDLATFSRSASADHIPRLATRAARVRAFFIMQAFGIFFLQKLGVPTGGASAQFILPWLYLGLGFLAWEGALKIDTVKLLLYFVAMAAAIAANILSGKSFSIPAIILLTILYLPFIFTIQTTRAEFVKFVGIYQLFMIAISAIVLSQHIAQLLFGAASWPNLDELIPEPLLFPGYNYMNRLEWGSSLFKPNGVFLLEPSFVSQFAMIAIALELVYFRRLWVLVTLGITQILSFSGSGLLIFALALPLFLPKLPPRIIMSGLIALIVLGAVAGSIGWFDQIASRAGEFNQSGTSGRYRYVDPILVMTEAARDPRSVFTGWGAGATREDSESIISLTFTKLFTEYGLIAFLAFYTFIIRSVFVETPSKRVAWTLFLTFNLGSGGLALPILIIPMLLLTGLFRFESTGKFSGAHSGA